MNGLWKNGRWLLLGVLVCLLPIWWWWWYCGPTTTLLVVRHADRQGNADALNPAGVTRAQELVHVGTKSGVAAVYHSNTERARLTAEPLAGALGLTPVVYPANDAAALVSTIFADHRGEKVFVVGHSNTVPDIIEAAGGPVLPDIDTTEFDNLFVVTACRCRRGPVATINLQYGAVSP